MLTFAQFLHDTADRGEAVNLVFEQRLFDLAGIPHKITSPFMAERVTEIAARNGFRFRHAAGLDMLLYGETTSARNAVHLLYSGEKVRPNQATPNPPIQPEKKRISGADVFIVPVAHLARMKLSAYRDRDRVHIRSMDAAGLITAEVENALPMELKARLQHIRETE